MNNKTLYFAALAGFLTACDGGRLATDSSTFRAENADNTTLQGQWKAGPAAWDDPQLAPHAAYGFATSNHPPAGDELPPYWQMPPAADVPESISGLELIATTPADVDVTAGFAAFGSLAILGGQGRMTPVIDISDPYAPKVLSRIPEPEGNHRGVQFIPYPNGRLLVVFANNKNIPIWDITNPRQPKHVTTLEPAQGNHNVGVVPGTPIIYNAASDGGGSNFEGQGTGFTEIYDLSDPENPQMVQHFYNGYSCHDVRFWHDPANNKHRAICAGVEYTQIWNTNDPLNPEVIVDIPVHHGVPGLPSIALTPAIFSHYAALNRDGTKLIVGDESGGGLAPACTAHVSTPSGGVSAPTGALFFYDVTDETTPVIQGWFSPLAHMTGNTDSISCTVHFGRLVPNKENKDLLAIGAYGAGVLLVDFTNPTLPIMVDQMQEGTDTWEAWYHNGYVLSSDLGRGLDVYKLK